MAFYHEIKEHMSPSAMSSWLNSRSSFIKSYFKGEKGAETKAMAFGTKVHALIEGGMLKAQHVYDHNEEEIRLPVDHYDEDDKSGLWFMGKPDSYTFSKDEAAFVDYKSGKANNWEEKLPTDIKMMATAWLVWRKAGEPKRVRGYVEFIETVWNPETNDIELVDDTKTVVVNRVYTHAELKSFTQAIIKAMQDVNAFYERWQASSGEFVKESDIQESVRLRGQIESLEADLEEVEDRIASQMDFGGEENHKTEGGTFYFKTTEAWDYPPELEFLLDGKEEFTLEKAERVASGVKAVKRNYELVNEPAATKRTLAYRSLPKKKNAN